MTDYTPPGPGEPGYPADFLASGFEVLHDEYSTMIQATISVQVFVMVYSRTMRIAMYPLFHLLSLSILIFMIMLMTNIPVMLTIEVKVVFVKAAMARDEARARRRAEEAKIMVRLSSLSRILIINYFDNQLGK